MSNISITCIFFYMLRIYKTEIEFMVILINNNRLTYHGHIGVDIYVCDRIYRCPHVCLSMQVYYAGMYTSTYMCVRACM